MLPKCENEIQEYLRINVRILKFQLVFPSLTKFSFDLHISQSIGAVLFKKLNLHSFANCQNFTHEKRTELLTF